MLSQDKCRLSVSGWFHGPTIERPAPYIEPRKELTPHISVEVSFITEGRILLFQRAYILVILRIISLCL